MIVIGVDPGTRHLGWGIVRRDGTRPTHVAHGVIDTDVTASIAVRLCQIERELCDVIAKYRPTASVVEALFFAKDATAAAKLGHARGVALLSSRAPACPLPSTSRPGSKSDRRPRTRRQAADRHDDRHHSPPARAAPIGRRGCARRGAGSLERREPGGPFSKTAN
jgi:crossover junction endodeoxyribonuclease RuvC